MVGHVPNGNWPGEDVNVIREPVHHVVDSDGSNDRANDESVRRFCKQEFRRIALLSGYIGFPDIGTELFAFEVGGGRLALRWYALAYIAGLIIGWRLCVALIRRPALWPNGAPPMATKQVEDLLTCIILGVILGGRLGYVLVYQPDYFINNPAEIIKIWTGGMSFHGGFIGVIIAGAVFSYRNAVPALSLADLLAVAAPAGLLLGRLANFTNNELWGRPTDVPWAVAFPGEAAQACAGIQGVCARHPSQLYEAALEGILLGTVLLFLALKKGWLRAPGSITGVFLVSYGCARFFVEFFRQPDAQFITQENLLGYVVQVSSIGLTMGQVLSLPMIGIGVVLTIYAQHYARKEA